MVHNQEVGYLSFADFREKVKDAKFFIRTGEKRPCSNIFMVTSSGAEERAVSYTHLDVYKRQMYSYPLNDKWIQDGYLESAAKYGVHLQSIHLCLLYTSYWTSKWETGLSWKIMRTRLFSPI